MENVNIGMKASTAGNQPFYSCSSLITAMESMSPYSTVSRLCVLWYSLPLHDCLNSSAPIIRAGQLGNLLHDCTDSYFAVSVWSKRWPMQVISIDPHCVQYSNAMSFSICDTMHAPSTCMVSLACCMYMLHLRYRSLRDYNCNLFTLLIYRSTVLVSLTASVLCSLVQC